MIEEKPLPWREILEVFFRRKWSMVVAGLLGLAVTAGIALTTPPTYTARAKILLTEGAVSGPREEAMSDKQIKAELHHLKSPTLVRSVLEFYQETNQPLSPEPSVLARFKVRVERRIESLYKQVHDAPTTTNLDARVQSLVSKLEPRSIGGTNVIEIACRGVDPRWTARFVNDLLDQHIKRIAKFNEDARASNFYLEQRNLLYVRWKEAQEALREFRKRYGADLLSGDESHLRKVLSQLEGQRVETETQVLENEAKVDFLAEQLEVLPDTIAAESTVTESETVRRLKQTLLDLQVERTELLSRYTPTSTRIGDMDQRIEHTRKLLTETRDEVNEEVMTAVNPSYQALNLEMVQTRARLVASQTRLDALEGQIDVYRDKLNRLEMLATELQRLKNDVENKENAHQNYLMKEEEARFSSSLDESGIVNLAVFERAEPPAAADKSKTLLIIPAGLVGGIVLGAFFGILRDVFDTRMKSSAQAHRISQAPILAEIPRS
ncbi:MAG: Wzz/FepE/Etk N-terminal domain-containing protein [Acidobacteriota bacterium]